MNVPSRSDIMGRLYGWMSWINKHSAMRIGLIVAAMLFAIASLIVSNRLVRQMAEEERRKMELWAAATEAVASSDYEKGLLFASRILESNTTIPMILVSESGQIISYNNIDLPRTHPERYLYDLLADYREGYPPIVVDSGLTREYLYYSDSSTLGQLLLFPYVQISVFLVILGVSVLAITSLKREDQNHIWEGMSRETAHQLGTPISSLMAWRELLMAQGSDPMIIQEMGKDIHRLEMIADRFQKIGSLPRLEPTDVEAFILKNISYMRPRIAQSVELRLEGPGLDEPIEALLSEPLIGWVFENLIKNAVDAMQGKGTITLRYRRHEDKVIIDVEDTGRGLPRSQHERIFRPGYTTRKRGWGLGLSLARRIVQDYHGGRIYVKQSTPGKGTTFRILLKAYAGDGEGG